KTKTAQKARKAAAAAGAVAAKELKIIQAAAAVDKEFNLNTKKNNYRALIKILNISYTTLYRRLKKG
ncbi:uncharacterized protein FA14DRAFT_161539, partial [Meira miltonrushii]